MTFPETYCCLKQNTFNEGIFSIVPIRYEDRFLIMKWRNEQIYHLRQSQPLTEDDQELYFKNTVTTLFSKEQPNQILFSYLRNGECIGYGGLVHINWIDRNAEISFIMDTALEEKEFELHWHNYLKLIEKVAFKELKLHKIYTYAFDLRPHLYTALEKARFTKEAVLGSQCYFNGHYKDVIIHSKINYEIILRDAEERDIETTFMWANDKVTRQNSFNSSPIEFSDHSKWFSQKLKQSSSHYLIAEADGKEAGLIRFDTLDGMTTIGILIDNKFRGKGLAPVFLKKSCEEFRKTSANVIIAFIKKENKASIKSFEKAGFLLKRDTVINNCEAFEYEYR